jgi:hypothetical protein
MTNKKTYNKEEYNTCINRRNRRTSSDLRRRPLPQKCFKAFKESDETVKRKVTPTCVTIY